MATVSEFLNLLYGQVDRGIYVWGGNGEVLDQMKAPREWIERHEKSAKDAERAITLYERHLEDGMVDIRAFDCSGLVHWALHAIGLQESDVSSRGLYSLCEHIEETELRPGDLVFHHDGTQIVHVGVYANDGDQIEAKGRDVGVVLNKRRSGYWNRFGRWKALDPGPEPVKTTVYVKGRSVYVRDVDYVPDDKKLKAESVIGVAHRGESYPLVQIAPTGWYQIIFKGQSGYISNRDDLTELR